MTGGGSAVVRRQLGSKLRQLRLAAGKDVRDVTEARLGSKAKISRIETGKGAVRLADVWALCRFYGADAETTEALSSLATGTQQETWWEAIPGGASRYFGLYAGLEETADTIRCFEPDLVPGLLQTEEYARAVISVNPNLSPEMVEQRVRLRMERQQRANGDVTAIMGETALRLQIGSAECMTDQFDRLRASSADVRVLPFSAGLTPRRGTWAMFTFDDAEDPPVVYVWGGGIARYLDKPADWAKYDAIWSTLTDRAVPIGEWPT